MGRDTGWLAAATALAKQREEDAPHLIYLPEIPFKLIKFFEDVRRIYESLGYAVIVVGEGLRGEDDRPLTESKHASDMDGVGPCQPGGIAQYLANMLAEHLDIRARFDKPGTIQRSSMICASKTDLEEAYMVGKMAVRYAVEGKSGFMVTLERSNSLNYKVNTGLVELGKVSNRVREFPLEFISKDHNFVTSEFINYFKPLLGGELPKYVKLKKYPVMTH
jgi:6-phosphofructokinase 1